MENASEDIGERENTKLLVIPMGDDGEAMTGDLHLLEGLIQRHRIGERQGRLAQLSQAGVGVEG